MNWKSAQKYVPSRLSSDLIRRMADAAESGRDTAATAAQVRRLLVFIRDEPDRRNDAKRLADWLERHAGGKVPSA